MVTRSLLALSALVALAAAAPTQRWQDVSGRSPAGVLAVRQAARDARADSLVLLVASHPDDRYVLPAVWLRSVFGLRVSVLLATRGGGGQNTLGPETGDAFERIRTLETETGCSMAGIDARYLNRPDAGYRRSAEETFAEWGREQTVRDLARLLRVIRPDAVVTTHHAEESHGHDLAVVDLLPAALRMAADPNGDVEDRPHDVPVFLLGTGNTVSPNALLVDADRLDPDRGLALRRIAYDILRGAHVSPGPPNRLEDVFGPVLGFEPVRPPRLGADASRPLGLPSVLDEPLWPGDRAQAQALRQLLDVEAPDLGAVAAAVELLRSVAGAPAASPSAIARIERRVEALQRLALALAGFQVEVDVPAGAVAVAGEEFSCPVRILSSGGELPAVRAKVSTTSRSSCRRSSAPLRPRPAQPPSSASASRCARRTPRSWRLRGSARTSSSRRCACGSR